MTTPNEFLCKKCLKKMKEYDAKRKKAWRLKIKLKVEQVYGKVEIKHKRIP